MRFSLAARALGAHQPQSARLIPRRVKPIAEPLDGHTLLAFFTVTGTADNADSVSHGGTGTQLSPFQMSSLPRTGRRTLAPRPRRRRWAAHPRCALVL